MGWQLPASRATPLRKEAEQTKNPALRAGGRGFRLQSIVARGAKSATNEGNVPQKKWKTLSGDGPQCFGTSAAVVGVVAGVCWPPDFGMTVSFISVFGMFGWFSPTV